MLGIDNEHLLHEIHNSEEFLYQQATYSQIQQNAENLDLAGEGLQGSPVGGASSNSDGSPLHYRVQNFLCKNGTSNSELTKGLSNTDLSPFNSKFTVLRFS